MVSTAKHQNNTNNNQNRNRNSAIKIARQMEPPPISAISKHILIHGKRLWTHPLVWDWWALSKHAKLNAN